ncbi:hypothetical protein BJ322DRAFT_1107806 [Thelephora terrestris]|uniref:Uncharacterized protein n=1 Tax=Thelephora terrestris TaxID=56493 RepID=A0A9P6HGT0_9AGAM|nr:hypothetical protein BJ322DRAFT_1107806 [Thelephora terrestris]
MSPKITGFTKPPPGGSKGGVGVRGCGDRPKRGRGRGKSRGKAKGQVAYKDTTDPEMVTGPVLDLADPALREAWMVNTDHRMGLIFDTKAAFQSTTQLRTAAWTSPTMMKSQSTAIQSDLSQKYKFHYCVLDPYSWQGNHTAELKWEAGQKPVQGFITLKQVYIPIPYIRLIDQVKNGALQAEYNQGHKAQYCGRYAQCTLDKFGEEVEGARQIEHPGPHMSAWHSKVLTPILQRQLQGVSDAYWPSIHAGVLDPEDGSDDLDRKMTIVAATKFY